MILNQREYHCFSFVSPWKRITRNPWEGRRTSWVYIIQVKGELPGEDSDSTEAAYMGHSSMAGHTGRGLWRMRASGILLLILLHLSKRKFSLKQRGRINVLLQGLPLPSIRNMSIIWRAYKKKFDGEKAKKQNALSLLSFHLKPSFGLHGLHLLGVLSQMDV